MATVFKTFLNNDIKSTRTLLHEAIPITGSIVSGTYVSSGNIKNYAHGMFQSIYDYPYLSSSANHIFDLTVGYSAQSALSSSTPGTDRVQQRKKINIYNQMAAVLMGYDVSGNVINFDQDGDLTLTAGSSGLKINEAVFINFARLLQKDEIKKGSFNLQVGSTQAFVGANNTLLSITDVGSETSYKINSAAGEFSVLTCSNSPVLAGNDKAGLIFYQAGVAVLTASIFQGGTSGALGPIPGDVIYVNDGITTIGGALTGTSIEGCCDAFRNRLEDVSFNNTTELNSTIHFCRINSSDYNYSSNPSYLSQSQIFVKNSMMDAPISYITTVGLYSSDNELLAVAKLSEPLKKDPTNEMIVRVRLDY